MQGSVIADTNIKFGRILDKPLTLVYSGLTLQSMSDMWIWRQFMVTFPEVFSGGCNGCRVHVGYLFINILIVKG